MRDFMFGLCIGLLVGYVGLIFICFCNCSTKTKVGLFLGFIVNTIIKFWYWETSPTSEPTPTNTPTPSNGDILDSSPDINEDIPAGVDSIGESP